MRRSEKEITDEKEIIKILKGGKFTTISTCKNNEPYIVTMSYGYDQIKNALYFHCAQEGLKIDFIKSNTQVCGTVIEDNGYEDGCGQTYRSVVFRGEMNVIEGIEEKKHGFNVLINHLERNPSEVKLKFLKNDNVYIKPAILRLDITEITGKEEKADG